MEGVLPFHFSEIAALYNKWRSEPQDKRCKITLSRQMGRYSISSAKKYRDMSCASLLIDHAPEEGPLLSPYKIEMRRGQLYSNRTPVLDFEQVFRRIKFMPRHKKDEYPFVSLGNNITAELFTSQLNLGRKKFYKAPVYGLYRLMRGKHDLFRGKVINYLNNNIYKHRTAYEYILQALLDTLSGALDASYVIADTTIGGATTCTEVNVTSCSMIASGGNNKNTSYKEVLFLNSLLRGHDYKIPSRILPYNILRHCNFDYLSMETKELKAIKGKVIVLSWSNVHWARHMSRLLLTLPNVDSVIALCIFL